MLDAIYYMSEREVDHIDFFTSLVAPEKIVNAAFESLEQTGIKTMMAITKHVYDGHGKVQTLDDEFDRLLERALKLPRNVEKHLGIVLNKYHTEEDIEAFNTRYGPMFGKDQFHIITQLNPWFNLVKDMASAEHGAAPASLEPAICDYPFILLHVGWNGDCIICCTDDVHGEGIMGHISDHGDLEKIWHGREYEAMREKHNSYNIDMAPCNHCERTDFARVEGFDRLTHPACVKF